MTEKKSSWGFNAIQVGMGSVIYSFLLFGIGVLLTWLGCCVLREFFENPPEKERQPVRKVRKQRKRR